MANNQLFDSNLNGTKNVEHAIGKLFPKIVQDPPTVVINHDMLESYVVNKARAIHKPLNEIINNVLVRDWVGMM